LKKANPTTKRLVAGKKKDNTKAVAKKIAPPARVQHIKATVPSPIPTGSTSVVEVVAKHEESLTVKETSIGKKSRLVQDNKVVGEQG
jgi:hypothetical protein